MTIPLWGDRGRLSTYTGKFTPASVTTSADAATKIDDIDSLITSLGTYRTSLQALQPQATGAQNSTRLTAAINGTSVMETRLNTLKAALQARKAELEAAEAAATGGNSGNTGTNTGGSTGGGRRRSAKKSKKTKKAKKGKGKSRRSRK
jgi:hypothetical protein